MLRNPFGPNKQERANICGSLQTLTETPWEMKKVRFLNLKGEVTSGKFFVTYADADSRFADIPSCSAKAIRALNGKALLLNTETLTHVGIDRQTQKNIIVVPVARAQQYINALQTNASAALLAATPAASPVAVAAEPDAEFQTTQPLELDAETGDSVRNSVAAHESQNYLAALAAFTTDLHFHHGRASWEIDPHSETGFLIHLDTPDADRLCAKLNTRDITPESHHYGEHTLVILTLEQVQALLNPATIVTDSSLEGRSKSASPARG